jgi:cytoskeletal protein CcmA (bactofilin family)
MNQVRKPLPIPVDPVTEKRTVIEDGSRIKGSLTSTCPILVQGSVEGDLEAPALTVSGSGVVAGKVTTTILKSHGKIAGAFDVDTAELSGTVEAHTVIRAAALDLKLASTNGKLQLTFGPEKAPLAPESHIPDPPKSKRR